jgi:hypothetical protein
VKFCSKCGLPLQIEAALEIELQRTQADDIMNKLLDDPEVRELILMKLKKLIPNRASEGIARPVTELRQ